MDDLFPHAEGYDAMTMDGWWYGFKSRRVSLFDSRMYSSSVDQENQKRRLQSVNANSFRLSFPDGNSPANSVTVVEKCKESETIKLTEAETIRFLRVSVGTPIDGKDFPIKGPYRYDPLRWEDRSRYSCNSQFQQWVRTPPQLCSVHHECMFFDIDSWLCNSNSKKSIMFEFKLERELERFYERSWQFADCMRVTDECVGENIIRMLVIFNNNESVTVQRIKRNIQPNDADVWCDYHRYDSLIEWSTAMKQLLS